MRLSFNANIKKDKVFQTIEKFLSDKNFIITGRDMDRPWGGFFIIDEKQSKAFIREFFPELGEKELNTGKKLSPKFLIVEPGKKLSWQYHFRRAEIWKVVSEVVGIVTSETDKETDVKKYVHASLINLKKGERHRLIGLEGWGIVAEIWQHTDEDNPSDEEDIIRLQDDYGR